MFFKFSLSLLIVAFWAVMTGWLVRTTWNDGNAPFSDLPPAVVFRQMLKHEVASNLGIFRGRQRIGSVTVTPISNPANAVSLDGNIAIPQPDARPETYNFSLRFDLDDSQLRPHTVHLRLSRRQPPLNVQMTLLVNEQKLQYTVKNGDLDLGTQEMILNGGALSQFGPLLAGLPPLPIDPTQALKSIQFAANRASIIIRGERMDGFRINVGTVGLGTTVTLGQLGEIFVVRTDPDYHLLAEGLEPQKYLP